MILKTFINLTFVMKSQVMVMQYYSPESYSGWGDYQKWDYHFLIYWLLIEVSFFYCNIISIFAFLVVSRFFNFHSLKDRAGYGGNNRKTKDFLEHASADIYWFSTVFSSIMLMSYVLKMHYQNEIAFTEYLRKRTGIEDASFSIAFSLTGICFKHLINITMLYIVFFKPSKKDAENQINWKLMITTRLVFCALLSSYLLYHFIQNS